MKRDLWRRLGLPWLRRPDFEDELDAELGFHLDMRIQELVDRGLDPAEARRIAARRFGDADATRRRYLKGRRRRMRRTRRRHWIRDLGRDLAFAARNVRRHRVFSSSVILVLALGIGAPTTVFSLVDAVFFQRPPGIVAPQELVRVFRAWAPGEGGGALQNPDYLYYRDNASTLSGLAAYGGQSVAAYQIGAGEPDQLHVLYVSDNYFDVLGTEPTMGRWFTPEENASPGADPVAVIGHGFWQRAFGSDPGVVGRQVRVNGTEMTIIGVAPRGFVGVTNTEPTPELWTPIAMYGALARFGDDAWWTRLPDLTSRWLHVVGRIAPGVSFEAARENIVALGRRLEYDGKDPDEGALVTRQVLYGPSQERMLGSLARVLLSAVLVVLAVAAANVALLLLSRGADRTREMAIRTSLGAGSTRLARQLLAETVFLGGLGGALGIALAYVSSDVAASLLPVSLHGPVLPDRGVLALAVGTASITSLAIGVAPAVQGARTDVRRAVRVAPPLQGPGRVRHTLVVVQVGLSVVLLTAALLFAASFGKASRQELGFDPEGVLALRTNLRNLGYSTEEGHVFHRRALERLAALPGVSGVTLSRQLPFYGEWSTFFDAPEGAVPNAPDDQIKTGLNAVGPDYFDIMGIPIVAGRAVGPGDREGGEPVAVVNQTLAQALWPDGEAVGRTLPRGSGTTVVGVARNATYYDLGEEPWAQVYLSAAQSDPSAAYFLVESPGVGPALAEQVQDELRQLEPRLTFDRVMTMTDVVAEQVRRYRVSAVLVGSFAAVALLLSSMGLYGVLSFLVSRRQREIGIRMALGADRSQVARQVLWSGIRLAVVGLALGTLGAVAFRRTTTDLLFDVDPGSPLPLVGAGLVLLSVAALACLVPTWRATRIHPHEVVQAE